MNTRVEQTEAWRRIYASVHWVSIDSSNGFLHVMREAMIERRLVIVILTHSNKLQGS